MKFETSTEQDIEQLTRWIENDPYHKDCLDPRWWLTGNGSLLSFRFDDSEGAVCYVRLDSDGHFCGLHTQFAPEQEVSKSRLVRSMLEAIPVIAEYAKQHGLEGIMFESTSITLIEFMKKIFGFQPAGGNDFVLRFEVGV
jgi:hypothetical protein